MPHLAKGSDVDKGWAWMVLLAVYCVAITLSASSFMGGVLYVAVLEEYGGDQTIASLICSLNSGLLCLLGPIASVYMNTFSCRISMITGGILVSLACFISAFVKQMELLVVTYGILGGIGNSLASTPLVVVLGYYFEKRRKTVISICTAVVGLGMFISSPMALAVLDMYGLSGAFLILSGLNAHLVVFGVICRPSSIEKHIHRKSKDQHYSQNMTNRTQLFLKRFVNSIKSTFTVKIFTNNVLTLFLFSTFTWNLMLSVFLMHLPNYMVTQKASSPDIVVIMTCFSVGNTAGRFLGAFVVDRKSNIFCMYIIALASAGILTTAFPFFSFVYILKYVFAAASGVLTGIPNSLGTPILLEIVGVDLLSTAHGLEYFFSGFGNILGPSIAGLLFSKTNTYESSFYFAGIVVTLGALFGGVSSYLFGQSISLQDREKVVEIKRNRTNEIIIRPECKKGEVIYDMPLLEHG